MLIPDPRDYLPAPPSLEEAESLAAVLVEALETLLLDFPELSDYPPH